MGPPQALFKDELQDEQDELRGGSRRAGGVVHG